MPSIPTAHYGVEKLLKAHQAIGYAGQHGGGEPGAILFGSP